MLRPWLHRASQFVNYSVAAVLSPHLTPRCKISKGSHVFFFFFSNQLSTFRTVFIFKVTVPRWNVFVGQYFTRNASVCSQRMSHWRILCARLRVCIHRGRVINDLCGQAEVESDVWSDWIQWHSCDSGSSAPAGCLLLHRQREHPAQAAPHPDRLHCHQGKYSLLSGLLSNTIAMKKK